MNKSTLAALLIGLLTPFCASVALAKDAHVVGAKAMQTGAGMWRFDVTVKSNDTGPKKYADRWDVLDQNGKILGTRILYHHHKAEQPFTRSLSGVRIPKNVSKVTIRARDKVNGYGGRTVTLTLKPRS